MKYLTIVIEYNDSDEDPRFGANMECLGGRIAGFMAGSFFDEQEHLEKRIENLEGLLGE